MVQIKLFDQNSNSSDKNKGQKRIVVLIVSCRNSAKPLNFLKEALYQMPLFVKPPVTIPRIRIIVLGWDDIHRIPFSNIVSDQFCAVSLIAQNITAL